MTQPTWKSFVKRMKRECPELALNERDPKCQSLFLVYKIGFEEGRKQRS